MRYFRFRFTAINIGLEASLFQKLESLRELAMHRGNDDIELLAPADRQPA